MDDGPGTERDSPRVAIVGLGPADLSATPGANLAVLLEPDRAVVVRTVQHPAAEQLAERRSVISCDDLYKQAAVFEDVYDAIAQRVLTMAGEGKIAYAVPGSPLVGEFAVQRILAATEAAVFHAPSFLDAVMAALARDPLERGFQLLDGHYLSSPLVLDKPTVVAHLDLPVVMAEVVARLGRVLDEATEVSIVIDAGSPQQTIHRVRLDEVDPRWASLRTSLFVDAEPGGLVGVVHTMKRLREECPWDRRQTHQSLVKNLIEECFELVEAISRLHEDEAPWSSHGALEDELGDVLLQVLFHSVIAAEHFDIDDVAENLRQKLIRRHPHVFADVEAGSAEEVKANWDLIKAEEKGAPSESILGEFPTGMPALSLAAKLQRRAARVGFDWDAPAPVMGKIAEEVSELAAVLSEPEKAVEELGDLLFSAVNLARHLETDPEVALRRAVDKFVGRFQRMEAMGPISGLDPDQLDQRWEAAKTGDDG